MWPVVGKNTSICGRRSRPTATYSDRLAKSLLLMALLHLLYKVWESPIECRLPAPDAGRQFAQRWARQQVGLNCFFQYASHQFRVRSRRTYEPSADRVPGSAGFQRELLGSKNGRQQSNRRHVKLMAHVHQGQQRRKLNAGFPADDTGPVYPQVSCERLYIAPGKACKKSFDVFWEGAPVQGLQNCRPVAQESRYGLCDFVLSRAFRRS